ncbi:MULTISPECIES: hypothetical protein [Shewanella]|uniref:hypothetical protein n=1 Tax=Shewanella TaxID=22 RepID=UPI0021141797|nr:MULTISPECIES: hypothetical protein [Shewanella]MCU8058830.1 hypothetical protein [Shewanella sp. SM35]MCU8067761.1 hypothetical protein [Shewanella sp. SM34]
MSGPIWETVKVTKFDVTEERFTADLWALEGSKVASFITSTLERELRYVPTPNAKNIKGMFKRFLYQDVTENGLGSMVMLTKLDLN